MNDQLKVVFQARKVLIVISLFLGFASIGAIHEVLLFITR